MHPQDTMPQPPVCPICARPIPAQGIKRKNKFCSRQCSGAAARLIRHRRTIEERFWSLVDRSGECWVWVGSRFSNGYGQFRIGGRSVGAHRVAWELTNGPIPNGLHICHHCDNPPCVRPSHLFAGTHSVNMQDAMNKGRALNLGRFLREHPERVARGDRSGARLHPESIVRGDRHGAHLHPERRPWGDRNGSRLHPEKLARGERHGSQTHPERVARGEHHGLRQHPERAQRGEARPNAKLTEDNVRMIRQVRAAGQATRRELAASLGVSEGLIRLVELGKIWRHVS